MDWPDDELLYPFPKQSNASIAEEDDADIDRAIALSLQENCAVEIEKKSGTFLSEIDEDYDLAFALSLEGSENMNAKPSLSSLSESTQKPLGIVDEQWEIIDPTPDIHALFLQFNARFFYGQLEGVEVKWSPRMTLCAGVCSYEGRGGLCSVRLSVPLLKLRPRRDLVQTLLHEMIHAYLFVTANNKDHDAHGPEFRKHMHRINKETGTKISVYHSFHDEVDLYRKHVWKCNGPCQKRSPYYGYVRRAMNRAPGPKDVWWAQHQSSCGGTFTKFSEPEGYKKKSTKTNQNDSVKRKPLNDTGNELSSIRKFLKTPSSGTNSNVLIASKNPVETVQGKTEIVFTAEDKFVKTLNDSSMSTFPSNKKNNVAAFTGDGFLLGSSSSSAPKSFLASVRQEIASSSSDASKNFFNHPKVTPSDLNSSQIFSNMSKKTPKESCVLGGQNSAQNNVGHKVKPVNKRGSQKAVPNVSNKPSHVQSSMDSFLTSPSRFAVKKDMNDTTKDHNLNATPKVQCPVCFKLFLSSEINSHLDSCLLC